MTSSEIFRVINPHGYFDKFFSNGIFPDGRHILSSQKLVFKQGECGGVGSSIVTFGNVTISCTIEASVSLESDASLVSVEIAETQQLDEKQSEEYCGILLSLFEKEYFVKRESMKCRNNSGEKLPLDWVFKIVVKVLSVDGDLLDSLVAAVGAALKNTKLPTIVLNRGLEDESAIEKTQILVDEANYHLEINNILMSCTFGIFLNQENKEILIVSPDVEISNVCTATVTVIIGNDSKIAFCRQRGSISEFQILRKMTEITIDRRNKFVEALQKS
ncbi:unnamed protein product [Caenorhabditis angaria]|uniref:Ribosomal RNA-processing protein 43 n=1 Tax=Caenorhabditis angaria TaxID=860376 RepID=A0A9P1IB55_9PELO|nr:unnamed protein product [Caenorhabditis angaria]